MFIRLPRVKPMRVMLVDSAAETPEPVAAEIDATTGMPALAAFITMSTVCLPVLTRKDFSS